jgi:hypothetical protein
MKRRECESAICLLCCVVFLCCYAAVLLCCSAMLLCCSADAAMLLCRSVTMLLCCYATLLPCCYAVVLLCFCATMLLCHYAVPSSVPSASLETKMNAPIRERQLLKALESTHIRDTASKSTKISDTLTATNI